MMLQFIQTGYKAVQAAYRLIKMSSFSTINLVERKVTFKHPPDQVYALCQFIVILYFVYVLILYATFNCIFINQYLFCIPTAESVSALHQASSSEQIPPLHQARTSEILPPLLQERKSETNPILHQAGTLKAISMFINRIYLVAMVT